MKNVLITGCYGGMGLATSKYLINEGYEVYGLDIAKKEEIEHLHFFEADLTKESSVIEAFNKIKEEGVVFDAIIHQAGIYDLNSLIEMSEKDFTRIFDINVNSIFRVNKTFLPLLKEKGKILITSSELGPLYPLPFTGLYGITKTTIERYAYSLRMELQLLGYQVVVVRPGAVDTGLLNISTVKLDKFEESTTHYSYNVKRFKDIVNKVETKKIPPVKIAKLVNKVLKKKKAKYVYNINRNFGLRMLNLLPKRMQNWIIKLILTKK